MTDEQARLRSYLQAQGGKLAPTDIIEKVRAAMEQLHEAVSAVPAARFHDRPSVDEWSGNEVMAHVVDTGARFGSAIVRILDGAPAGPPLADRIEADAPLRAAAEWWAQLARDREALFARVLAADPGGNLDRTIAHPFFGPLNWRESLLFLRLHDLDHAGQLQKIATALT